MSRRQPQFPTRPALILGFLGWLALGWCAWQAERMPKHGPDVGGNPPAEAKVR